jgi:hypothetical protein
MPITEGGQWSPDRKIISPGVFTREIDQSGIAQGVADIGAVVVAPFAKGPGFSPTLCSDMTTLQQAFGVPDGNLYGPYTAQQYLQEKGFVTVCRVGALTGYHQKYPWVIWAEEGNWLRYPDAGWLDYTISSISSTGLYFISASSNGITANSAGYTGSITFTAQPVTLTLINGVATANPLGSNTGSMLLHQPYPASGSTLYTGQTVAGHINGIFSFTGSLNVSTASATSASLISQLFTQGLFSGNIYGVQFTSSQVPFNTANFYGNTLQISQSYGICNLLVLNIAGCLTGSLGKYGLGFLAGSNNTFDPCTGIWTASGSAIKVLAVLADTQNAEIDSTLHAPGFLGSTQSYNPLVSGSTNIGLDFDIQLSQSLNGAYGTYHFSLNPESPKYITNVFGEDSRAGNPSTYVQGTKIEAAYLYKLFEDDIAVVATDPTKWQVHGDEMPSGSWTGEPLNFTDQWSLNLLNGDSAYSLTNAYTPWILSQQISAWNGGKATRFPLFQLATLSDGTYTNTSFKIEISNVKLAGTVAGSDWGSFTLTVRAYSDTDKRPQILEQFNNLSLDPTSANFIARRIGDRYNYIRFDGKIIEFGTYTNNSKNIRVVMSPNPYPTTAVPYGFQALSSPVNGAIGNWCNPMAYTKASIYSLFPGKYTSGIDFVGVPPGADAELTSLYPTSSVGEGHWKDNLQYFAPLPAGSTIGSNTEFALDDVITVNGVGTGSFLDPSLSGSIPSTYDAANETTYVKMRKFVFGFQGGFDGQSPAIPENVGEDLEPGNTQGLDCTNSTTAGSIAYNQCIGALGNADEFDINLIVVPGIIYSLHSYVTTLVVEMCENRGDCFFILDMYKDSGNPTTGQIDEVVNLAKEFDTNYAGTYYPWVKILDTNINQIVTVPPSVVLLAVYAANDKVAAEWYAVAGLNRGGITQAVQLTDRTTHTERDTLYEGKVNPICTFPGQGIVVWGQKTLQNKDSATNRINVRRLLIAVKKFFASTARYLVFEQNTAETRNKFLAIVNPYLESVQQRSGLYAFQVKMDASNNTPDLIDQNILYGQIYLQPTRTAEFILLDFYILPSGASFPTA